MVTVVLFCYFECLFQGILSLKVYSLTLMGKGAPLKLQFLIPLSFVR